MPKNPDHILITTLSAMLEQLFYSKKCNGYIRLDDVSCTLLSNGAKKFAIEWQE